jgi:hypothetical protein
VQTRLTSDYEPHQVNAWAWDEPSAAEQRTTAEGTGVLVNQATLETNGRSDVVRAFADLRSAETR